jgi:hypothetical protein
VARDHVPLRIEHGDGGLARDAEAAGQLAVRVVDLRPAPAVLLEVGVSVARLVGDVEPDEAQLGMGLDELRVGDRLAVADRSPRGPDVCDNRRAPKLRERARGLGRRLRRAGGGASLVSPARDEAERQYSDERERAHAADDSPRLLRPD